jgi:transcriptional regulator GlxA family with amidase domain
MPRKVVLLGFPGVQSLDVIGPFEVFAGASQLVGGGYDVVVGSRRGDPVTTYAGLTLVAEPLPNPQEPVDTVVLPGGGGVDVARTDPEIIGWIRAVAASARRVVSVCTGAFLAAEAGLLDGCPATTHWAFANRLAREFPAIALDPEPIFARSSKSFWPPPVCSRARGRHRTGWRWAR